MRYIMTGGNPNPQPQQQQGFGQTNMFGAGTSTGISGGSSLNFGNAAPSFGANKGGLNFNSTPATTTGGFSFGNNNNNQTGGFLNNNNNQAGGFLNNNNNQAGGFLNNTNTGGGFNSFKPGNNLFGNNANTTAIPLGGNTTGNMFNNTANTGNMFNNTQPTTTGFSFGNKT